YFSRCAAKKNLAYVKNGQTRALQIPNLLSENWRGKDASRERPGREDGSSDRPGRRAMERDERPRRARTAPSPIHARPRAGEPAAYSHGDRRPPHGKPAARHRRGTAGVHLRLPERSAAAVRPG